MSRKSQSGGVGWRAGLLAVFLSSGPVLAGDPVRLTSVQDFEPPAISVLPNGSVRVRVKGCETLRLNGKPALPFRTVRLTLPPNTTVESISVRISEGPVTLKGRWEVEFGRTPLPLRVLADRRAFPPDEPDPVVYRATNAYPAARCERVSIQRKGDLSLAVIRVFPVVFIPPEGRLEFVRRMILDVRLADDAQVPEARTMKAESAVSYDYLLVTRAALLESFQPLVDSKTGAGLAVVTETMENVTNQFPGVDAAEKLRNFIRSAHANWGIRYVLLGGDTAQVPTRGSYGHCSGITDNAIPSDLYFACLDGSWNGDGDALWGEPGDGDGGGEVDLLAEVIVGRAPVHTPEETARFVAKTLAWQAPDATTPFQSLFAAEILGDGSAQGGDALDRQMPFMNEGGFGVEWLDDRPFTHATWTMADGVGALNRSPGLVMHHGHADFYTVMRLDSGDVGALTNGPGFFLYSAGCDAGAFDDPFEECVGEILITQTAHGAAAAILNSREGWFDEHDERRFSGEFQERLLEQWLGPGNPSLGTAHQAAKEALLGCVETSGSMPYRWCYFDLNLFGDPHTPISRARTTVLENGVPAGNLEAGSGDPRVFKITVPAFATNLEFVITGGTGEANLMVRFGAVPVAAGYDAFPNLPGHEERVTVVNPQPGDWYAALFPGPAGFSGVQLTASRVVDPTPEPAPVIRPAGGLKIGPVRVEMSCLDAEATIRYTLDGAVPTTESDAVTAPITLPPGVWTVTAKAFKAGRPGSAATTAVLTIVEAVKIGKAKTVSGVKGAKRYFAVRAPEGAKPLTLTLTGGSGNANLYVSRSVLPTLTRYEAGSEAPGTGEKIVIPNPKPGKWYYILINGKKTYEGALFRVSAP